MFYDRFASGGEGTPNRVHHENWISDIEIHQTVSHSFFTHSVFIREEAYVRRRFTLAHELGHYFLHPNKNTFIEYRDNKEKEKEKVVRSPKEVEANKFAAAILMPKKFLIEDVSALRPGIQRGILQIG